VRGYIDCTAGEIRTGDTIIDPHSGVLARVESVETGHPTMVALHMRGSVSRSYMGLSVEHARPLRRAPRPEESVSVRPAEATAPPPPSSSAMCACGALTAQQCAVSCLKG
jgi:hypothetical protein